MGVSIHFCKANKCGLSSIHFLSDLLSFVHLLSLFKDDIPVNSVYTEKCYLFYVLYHFDANDLERYHSMCECVVVPIDVWGKKKIKVHIFIYSEANDQGVTTTLWQ